MEFVQQGSKDYSDEDDQEAVARETSNFFPSNSSDWVQECSPSSSSSRSTDYGQLMDLSLGSGTKDVEREHMFDKVVTPSDVGKLNRLVIPKQHAEKYFPLDSSSHDKGLLLNFEDRSGTPWRFRYSYWNSSQSYVMTKGWSRFVKDKKLHAGDIVSFHRALGDRLFIDWRHRPQTPLPHNLRWASPRLYSMPQAQYYLHHNPSLNYNYNYQNHPYHRQLGFGHQHYVTTSAPEPVYYHQYSSPPLAMQQRRHVPMVIDSVPLLTSSVAVGKNKLRLFGVNMECGMGTDDEDPNSRRRVVLPSTALSPMSSTSSASMSPQFSEKGKSSLSFDLDLQT